MRKNKEKVIFLNWSASKDFYLNIALIALLVVIIPYLILAFFSVPSVDDFSQAAEALDLGILGFLKYRYLTWNGRYSSDLIISSYNILGHRFFPYFLIKFFWIVPLFVMVLYLFSNYLFISLLTDSKKIKLKLLYSLIILMSILTNTQLDETVFWLAGAAAYSVANALFMVSFALTIYTLYIDQKNLLLVGLNLLLIPFINGLSETIMIAYTSVIFSMLLLNITIMSRSVTQKLFLNNCLYSGIAIISSLIVYFAPGNVRRSAIQGTTKYAGNFLSSVIRSFLSTINNVFHWLNPYWICLVILLVFFIAKILTDKVENFWKNRRIFTIIIISLIVSLYLSYFVRWYAQNTELPLRANSVSYTLFLMITIVSSFYLAINFNFDNLGHHIKTNKTFLSIVTIFCFFSLSVNYELLANDFRDLKKHYAYYQTIYPLLINAKETDDIELPPEPKVKILRLNQHYLTPDKDNWTNQGLSHYFKVNSVISVEKKFSKAINSRPLPMHLD